MKDLKASRGRYFIENAIAQGEHERQDFKYAVNDARKIARSLSAFANHSGGRLLIGVKDNGVVAGVRNDEDVYVVEAAAQIYCVPPQEVTFTAYRDAEGSVVIVAEVARAPQRPVRVKEEGDALRAYYRVADENIAASGLMVRAWTASDGGRPVEFDAAAEGRVLDALRVGGLPMSVKDLCGVCRMSQRSVERAVVRLYAMRLAEFVHTRGGFMVTCTDVSE